MVVLLKKATKASPLQTTSILSLLSKASCSFLIVGSLLVFSLNGPMGVEGSKYTGVIRDATVINDTASLSFTISVPDDASSTIVTKMEQEAEGDEVGRTLRKKKKGGGKGNRGAGKGNTGKGNIQQEDRVIETSPTLKECIQDVLDEGATGSLPFIDDRAIDNQAPENDREETLEIRHLLEEDLYEDEFDDQRMSTCDAEITEEMQEKVRWKQ